MFLAEKKIAFLKKKLLQKQYVFNIGHTEKKNKQKIKQNNVKIALYLIT